MSALTPAKKGLILLAILAGGMLISAMASNMALFLGDAHDGGLHIVTVWQLISGQDEDLESYASLSLIICFLIVFFPIIAIYKNRKISLHGEARWASEKEIKAGGFLEIKGILVGKKNGKYLTFGGSEHVIVYAPTRGGKGVGVVVPNLLNWPDSCVVLDIKKENWQLTSGFRQKHGQKVYLFDPLDRSGRTARYNPFAYVDRSTTIDLYDDLQKIGAMLLPVEQQGDAFWTRAARTGFLAVAGYVAETPSLPFTIGEVYRQLAISADLKSHLLREIVSRESAGPKLSGQCKTAMNDFLAASDNTFSSVRKTISAQLELWNNARIDRATSGNDFDLRELRREPISIYIGVTPDNLARMAPLINLFMQQVVDLNTRTLPEHDPSLNRQVMLMLDEFPAIGNVEVIQKGVAYVAGYGLRLVTIVQSPSQLYGVYGEHGARNYMTNHAVEVVFTPKELAISKELSERFGTDTVKSRSVSKGIGMKAKSTNKSQSESDQGRALMLPQELVLTPFEHQYIIKGGMRPISAEKILYFKDKTFTKRLIPPPIITPLNDSNLVQGSGPIDKSPQSGKLASIKRDPQALDVQSVQDGDVEIEVDDMSLDFSGVELSVEDLGDQAAVDAYLDTVLYGAPIDQAGADAAQ